MGPASIHGTLSLMARCNDVQCCLHGMFIIVISNDDLKQKLTLLPTLCKGVRQQSCSVGYIHSMLLAKPFTELTTIWLDNVMDNDPPGDETGCSLSVIVSHHCYDFEQCIWVKPVLAFGTEWISIVNSRCLSLNVLKDQVKQSLMSFTKNATCESGIVLVSLRTSISDRLKPSSSYQTQRLATGLYTTRYESKCQWVISIND
jgi:hypothetical protein